jgi:hypothetical protein
MAPGLNRPKVSKEIARRHVQAHHNPAEISTVTAHIQRGVPAAMCTFWRGNPRYYFSLNILVRLLSLPQTIFEAMRVSGFPLVLAKPGTATESVPLGRLTVGPTFKHPAHAFDHQPSTYEAHKDALALGITFTDVSFASDAFREHFIPQQATHAPTIYHKDTMTELPANNLDDREADILQLLKVHCLLPEDASVVLPLQLISFPSLIRDCEGRSVLNSKTTPSVHRSGSVMDP